MDQIWSILSGVINSSVLRLLPIQTSICVFFPWSEAWEGVKDLAQRALPQEERVQMALTVGGEELQAIEEITAEDRL